VPPAPAGLPTDGHAHGAYGGGPAVPPEPSGPVFIGPLESVFRYPLFAIVPVVALVLIGLLVGVARDAVYTAEARINVGRVDVPAYTLQGVTIGNSTLAASYARAIAAPQVIERAARDAHVPVDEARGNLIGSQIPKSTLIRIEADGSSSAEAQRLANAASLQLIRYVTRLNVRQQEDQALQRYRRAQREAQQARTKVLRISRNRPTSAAAEKARIDLQTALLHARSVGAKVVQATVAPSPQNLLQLVVPAATADSDRGSVLQESLLIGLVAGIVLGFAAALLRANWVLIRGSLAR
jgi:hypothetical protein